MAMLKAVVFDADGTILDTREFIFVALERTLATYGYEVPSRKYFAAHMGKHLPDMYAALIPGADHEALAEHHRELHREELLPLLSIYEGLHTLLQRIRSLDMKVGVCTNRGSSARDLVRHLGIEKDIDVLITADDVVNHKPHPESLLKTLDMLDVPPEEAVMVGDTTADIGAGKAARVAFTVGVTHGFSTETVLREAGADHIAHHLDDVLVILETYLK